MATNLSNPQGELLRLINEISFEVHFRKNPCPSDVVRAYVARVEKENLGTLILAAEEFASQFTVKSRIGFPRYTESWEEYLREMLHGIFMVGLSFDHMTSDWTQV